MGLNVEVFETSKERTHNKDNLARYNFIVTGAIIARIHLTSRAIRISTYTLAVVLKYEEKSLPLQ